MIGHVTKSDSEKVIGVDAHNIPIVDCPEFVPTASKTGVSMVGKQWYICSECGNECFHEIQGRTYYHKLSCSHSNGIGYGSERIESPVRGVRPDSWMRRGAAC
jgi:hypothetical protein